MTAISFRFILILLMSGGVWASPDYHNPLGDIGNGGGVVTEQIPLVERINGTENFRIHGKRGKDEKTWFEGREMKHIYCARVSKCEKLRVTKCLGSQLPYVSTSLDLSDSYSQEDTVSRLETYQALKYVPKCWAVIQPFLCAVFMPKCEKIHGQEYVYLPSMEMCRITMEPCRILYNTTYFPDFLKCNETVFPSKCNNDVREIKFNVTGQCMKPLIPADAPANFYEDIEGCGVECKDPLFTDDVHAQIHNLIGFLGISCLACNLYAIITFMIDWQNARKHPSVTVFYMNFCSMMTCIGWLAQFTPGGREDIVCRKDGTLRHSEPSTGENLSCIVVFVLIYYFQIAAMVWSVIFLYAWHMCSKTIQTDASERIDKKGSYSHLVAWSLPLVLTITIMALSEIDGNSVVGICFVGYLNLPMRAFLFGPILAVLLIGGYLVGGGMRPLVKLKRECRKEIISVRYINKIRASIVRMGLYSLFNLVFILATIVFHIYEFRNADDWRNSLRTFILCKITTSHHEDFVQRCMMQSRPSVAILQLHLLCTFGTGIMMSSWVWNRSTVNIWKRYVKKKFGYEVERPGRIQKHELVAQAYAKRKTFQEEGRLSLSFWNTHTDPVGLNFNIDNTDASQDFSSTWANNLPRFVNRRCALTGAVTSSSHEPRRNSMDSEISVSVRHVSVESRRNSVDSQVSVKIAEMKTKVARGRPRKSKRLRRSQATGGERCQELLEYTQNHGIDLENYKNHPSFQKPYKNTKRRSASAGLNPKEISSLLANGKMLLPLLNNQKIISSDDENASIASFQVKNSRLDVILKRIGGQDDSSDEESQDFTIHDSSGNMKDDNTTDDEKSQSELKKRLDLSSNDDLVSKDHCHSLTSVTSDVRKARSSRRHRKMRSCDEKKDKSSDYSFSSLESSYSGGGKSNSRNSKRSCDVGIQANAYEISTQMSLAENGISRSEAEPKKRNEEESLLSQSDKLKKLLLP
ncbi:Protein smoothened [Sergentomyia squamirostris]